MKIKAIFLGLLLLSTLTKAAEFNFEWDVMPDAKLYEYEISEGSDFKKDALIKQGTTSDTKIDFNLRAGIYYVRIRSIAKDGSPGRWSSPLRHVLSGAAPIVQLPKEKEVIEVPSEQTPIFFSWASVEDASDYDVKIYRAQKLVKSQTVQTASVSIGGLGFGKFSFEIISRVNGEPISKTELIEFEVKKTAMPRPRILEPLESEIVTAGEIRKLRWARQIPGDKTTVEILRLSPEPRGILQSYELNGVEEMDLPALLPGRYQLTVKDQHPKVADAFSKHSVTVVVEKDPLGRYSKKLGAFLRIFGGPSMGWMAHQNKLFSNPNEYAVDRGSASNWNVRLESRLPWIDYGLLLDSYTINHNNYLLTHGVTGIVSTGEPQKISINDYGVRLGTWKHFPSNHPNREMKAKAALAFNEYKQYKAAVTEVTPHVVNFRSYGVWAAFEVLFTFPQTKWDVFSELSTHIPLFAEGNHLAKGWVFPFPSLHGTGYVRRKFWDDYRWLLGLDVHLETIWISEKGAAKTKHDFVYWGPRIGLQWEF